MRWIRVLCPDVAGHIIAIPELLDSLHAIEPQHGWPGLRSIVMVEATRDVKGHVSTERRYYLSSPDLPRHQARGAAVGGDQVNGAVAVAARVVHGLAVDGDVC